MATNKALEKRLEVLEMMLGIQTLTVEELAKRLGVEVPMFVYKADHAKEEYQRHRFMQYTKKLDPHGIPWKCSDGVRVGKFAEESKW